MAITREIPFREWGSFLNSFSERNQARRVRLEVAVLPGEGEPVLAENEPLLGVEFDAKGSEAPAIVVALGGTDTETPRFTHVLNDLRRVWVEEEADGLAIGVQIESLDEGKTRLLFQREAALPAGDAVTVGQGA